MGTIFYTASEDSEFFKKGDSISLTIASEPGEVSARYDEAHRRWVEENKDKEISNDQKAYLPLVGA